MLWRRTDRSDGRIHHSHDGDACFSCSAEVQQHFTGSCCRYRFRRCDRLINGLLVTKLKLPAFLATLGMMELVRGGAMWITDTAAVPIENKTFCNIFGIGEVAGIPVLVLWTILFYIVGILIFNKGTFGRHILATAEMRTRQYTAVSIRKK